MIYQSIAFLIISAWLVIISRASLRSPGSHGFFRFFAWEFILALILLHIPLWFQNPFVWYQVISWILLFASFIPLGFGVPALISRGKPVQHRQDDDSLLAFEKTSQLVTTGIYRYIRHPLYSSLLLLTWGVAMKNVNGIGPFLAVCATLFLIATAKADEAECIRYFGAAYQAYMKTTSRFIPFVF